MITPVLETSRLRLRPFRREDARAVFDGWEQDPEVARYMFWTSHQDIRKTEAWLEYELGQIGKPDWYRFAVEQKPAHTLIGTVLIYYEEELETWEVGYNFAKAHWGRGYATEAMTAVLTFAKAQLGISQAAGRYAKENPASGRVLEKLGFRFEKEIPYFCNDGTVLRQGVLCRLTWNKTER
ncbi:MAG: GNAT family N-acetyltransferase [Bacillota bacterium]|nr:GNAT family N-acetyltransferase [Bacillota bacterium]